MLKKHCMNAELPARIIRRPRWSLGSLRLGVYPISSMVFRLLGPAILPAMRCHKALRGLVSHMSDQLLPGIRDSGLTYEVHKP